MNERDLKAALRRECKAARTGIPEPDRAAWSAAIRGRLVTLDHWNEADCIALYAPVAGEVDLIPLIREARGRMKRLVFPRAVIRRTSLEFYEVRDADELRPGAFGVPEPPDREDLRVAAGGLDLVVLPGLAFDLEGRRLGFGGGYYDRLLGHCPRPAVGVAFECQIRERLPREPHDRGVDSVVTESRVIEGAREGFAPGGGGGGNGGDFERNQP